MTLKFRSASGLKPALLLSATALSFVLALLPAPAHAEVVTLICQNELAGSSWGGSFTLRVDYDRGIVDFLRSDGSVALSSAATVSDSDVRWDWDNSKWDYNSDKAQGFMGGVNRLSGVGSAYFVERQVVSYNMSGLCRRATQKF